MKCKIKYCRMARFFYFKLNCDYESDFFGVNPSLTVVTNIIFKFLSFVSMELIQMKISLIFRY